MDIWGDCDGWYYLLDDGRYARDTKTPDGYLVGKYGKVDKKLKNLAILTIFVNIVFYVGKFSSQY